MPDSVASAEDPLEGTKVIDPFHHGSEDVAAVASTMKEAEASGEISRESRYRG